MEMDCSIVTLRAGYVLVQHGTIHDWHNRSDKPCVIAFVLIDARPVEKRWEDLACAWLVGGGKGSCGLKGT